MAQSKGGRMSPEQRQRIEQELKRIVESGQILGTTETQLATRLEVNRKTINRYLKRIFENTKPEDIHHIQVKMEVAFNRIFREAQLMVQQASGTKEKRESMEFMLKAMEKFMDFLERFGIKDKTPDKLELQTSTTSELKQIWEEVQREEREEQKEN